MDAGGGGAIEAFAAGDIEASSPLDGALFAELAGGFFWGLRCRVHRQLFLERYRRLYDLSKALESTNADTEEPSRWFPAKMPKLFEKTAPARIGVTPLWCRLSGSSWFHEFGSS